VNREDVRVLQVRRERDLALEARRAHFACQLGGEEFDHDLAVERAFGSQEEAAHAARRQLTLDPILIAECLLQLIAEISVCHTPRLKL
jgi:hypothetical protein